MIWIDTSHPALVLIGRSWLFLLGALSSCSSMQRGN